MKKKQVKIDFEVPVYLTFIIPELLPLIVGKMMVLLVYEFYLKSLLMQDTNNNSVCTSLVPFTFLADQWQNQRRK